VENHLVLAGAIARRPEVRYSPAGVPIARFTLHHDSERTEAGYARAVRCTIGVMACGPELAQRVAELEAGAMVRVRGFLARSDNRQGIYRLILHAETIELLSGAVPPEVNETGE